MQALTLFCLHSHRVQGWLATEYYGPAEPGNNSIYKVMGIILCRLEKESNFHLSGHKLLQK